MIKKLLIIIIIAILLCLLALAAVYYAGQKISSKDQTEETQEPLETDNSALIESARAFVIQNSAEGIEFDLALKASSGNSALFDITPLNMDVDVVGLVMEQIDGEWIGRDFGTALMATDDEPEPETAPEFQQELTVYELLRNLLDNLEIDALVAEAQFKWASDSDDEGITVIGKGFELTDVAGPYYRNANNFFQNNGFKIDSHNSGDGTLIGAMGFTRKNVVCLVKVASIVDEEEEDDPKSNLSVSCGKIAGDRSAGAFYPPLLNATARVTKKPFGIYVEPGNSPIDPEQFTGYHTGTDFEIFDNELEEEVMVTTICEGTIIKKPIISGYGGVIVQECELDGERINVLYGHLAHNADNAIALNVVAKAGVPLAPLADDRSELSGGERKHLHLGIIRGTEIDVSGYVDSKVDLAGWIDFEGGN